MSPPLRAQALAAPVIGLFFAVTSPYGAVTYLPWFLRWPYWVALIAVAWGIQHVLQNSVGRHLSALRLVLAASVAATPAVLATILTVQSLIGHPVAARYWLSLSASIWVINLALATMRWLLGRLIEPRAPVPAAQVAGSSSTRAAPLRQRLPAEVAEQPILALCAQDHYVQVQLASGNHLVHARFSDAVAMLADEEEGLTVHRSWWVARSAVARVERSGRRMHIVLQTGQEVPVSRSGAARVREARWAQVS